MVHNITTTNLAPKRLPKNRPCVASPAKSSLGSVSQGKGKDKNCGSSSDVIVDWKAQPPKKIIYILHFCIFSCNLYKKNFFLSLLPLIRGSLSHLNRCNLHGGDKPVPKRCIFFKVKEIN